MNPRDFYTLALELSKKDNPAHLRSAISRAYYAVYNTGFNLLKNNMGFPVPEGSAGHGDVKKRLNNGGNEELRKAASKMGDLHNLRIKADYNLNDRSVESCKTVEAWMKTAGEIITTLDYCETDPNRSQIIKAIQDYDLKIKSAAYK